jgi:hypothetical protein
MGQMRRDVAIVVIIVVAVLPCMVAATQRSR